MSRVHRLGGRIFLAGLVLIATAGPGWGHGGGHGGGGHGGGHGGGGWHGGGWHGGGWHGGWGGYGWGRGYGWGGGWGWGWGYPWYGYGWGYPGYGWGYGGYGGYYGGGFGGYGGGYGIGYGGGSCYQGGPVGVPVVGASPAPAATAAKDGTARFQIDMPGADAQVWLNGVRTKQTGPNQQYKSPPLNPGEKYAYEVRARWTENGRSVERTQTILVRADQRLRVDLGQQPAVAAKVPPTDKIMHLNVTVPADAEVWLNGVRTKQTGAYRQFKSPALKAGEKYAYEVRVRWQKDGKPTEETRQVQFRAGQKIDLDLSNSAPGKGIDLAAHTRPAK